MATLKSSAPIILALVGLIAAAQAQAQDRCGELSAQPHFRGIADGNGENDVYRRLKVRTEGRDVFLPEAGKLYEATSFISVLSIPLLVDELVPKLAAAADGDPATVE